MRASTFSAAGAALCLTLAACGSGGDHLAPTLSLNITGATLHSNIAVLEGVADSTSITIDNPGPDLTGVRGQAWVVEGAARRSGADAELLCGGASGVVPTGPCATTFPFIASAGAPGTGTITPGPASVEVRLVDTNGAVLGLKTVPLTLVPDSVSIYSVDLVNDTLTIGAAPTDATTRTFNPGASRTGAGIQGWVVQGAARRAANGGTLSCGSGAGVFPPGSCTTVPVFSASNTGSGTGTLVAGAATLEVDLTFGGAVAYAWNVPVILK